MSTLLKPPSVKFIHKTCFILPTHIPTGRFSVFVLVPQEQNLELMLVMLSILFWKLYVIWQLLKFQWQLSHAPKFYNIFFLCHKTFFRLEAFYYMRYVLLIFWYIIVSSGSRFGTPSFWVPPSSETNQKSYPPPFDSFAH